MKDEQEEVRKAARLLSQLGASKGGQARAAGLTPERRSQIARNAARTRWQGSKSAGRTVKCPICGKPYKFYAHSAADQSACPKCVREAEANT